MLMMLQKTTWFANIYFRWFSKLKEEAKQTININITNRKLPINNNQCINSSSSNNNSNPSQLIWPLHLRNPLLLTITAHPRSIQQTRITPPCPRQLRLLIPMSMSLPPQGDLQHSLLLSVVGRELFLLCIFINLHHSLRIRGPPPRREPLQTFAPSSQVSQSLFLYADEP